jgi:hypothetical protein
MKRSPLRQYTPLKSKTPLKAYAPINKVSAKQAQINKELAFIKAQMLAKQIEDKGFTYCEKCGIVIPQAQLQLVHKKGRGRGGAALDKANLSIFCMECHYGLKMGDHYNEH